MFLKFIDQVKVSQKMGIIVIPGYQKIVQTT